jgi:hypothetical protein
MIGTSAQISTLRHQAPTTPTHPYTIEQQILYLAAAPAALAATGIGGRTAATDTAAKILILIAACWQQ